MLRSRFPINDAYLRVRIVNEGVIFINECFEFRMLIVSIFNLLMKSKLGEVYSCMSTIHVLMVSISVDNSFMFTSIYVASISVVIDKFSVYTVNTKR